MRVDVRKFLFLGLDSDKTLFFQNCQNNGLVEFISDNETIVNTDNRYIEALKVLSALEVDSDLSIDHIDGGVDNLVQEILTISSDLVHFREQIKTYSKEILRVKPLGPFSSDSIKEINKRSGLSLRFFYCKHHEDSLSVLSYENIFKLSSAHGYDYFVVVGVVPLLSELYKEIEAPKSYNELEQDMKNIKSHILKHEHRLKELYLYKNLILSEWFKCRDINDLEATQKSVNHNLDSRVFSISGWCAKDKIDRLKHICEQSKVYIYEVKPDEDEIIPTCLQNIHYVGAVGEDIIHIYDTPSSNDKDPSSWVFICFILFFSMIVNDAGYGLVFVASAFILDRKWKNKIKRSPSLKRFIKMVFILGMGCVVWGVSNTSFFGISLDPHHSLKRYSMTHFLASKRANYYVQKKPESYKLLIQDYPELSKAENAKDLLFTVKSKVDPKDDTVIYNKFVDSVLLELSLFVGSIHIILGLMRYLRYHYAGLGWMVFICGAYLYVPSYLDTISIIHYLFHIPYDIGALWGYYSIWSGMSVAVVLSLIQNRLGGLSEITQVVQVFSDVLSYIRIYALGLAGSMMASTFNDLGYKLPIVIGTIVVVLGHAINIILSAMGGVIHGLRLNFIEWYRYSFHGGGKLFKPLKKWAEKRR